jgi:DNA repair protein RecN (Recombination protein N)
MLTELHIENLGVIESATITLDSGLVALTGETGAGKTMIVEAIGLLLGGRADAGVVRPGADEARIEGRFIDQSGERILTRVVPADGRSRAYVNGRMATVAQLSELGAGLVDIHGQHAHQSLLSASDQRDALDEYAEIDLTDLHVARDRLTEIDAILATLGGDERARAREIDLLRFQVGEIDDAGIRGGDEERELEELEDVLADATHIRESAWTAVSLLSEDGGAIDQVGSAVSGLGSSSLFAGLIDRLRNAQQEIADVAHEIRGVAESTEEDPSRLAEVRARRQLLLDLRRKYGESLDEVVRYGAATRARLAELEGFEARALTLEHERAEAMAELARAQAEVSRMRRAAAPGLASAVQSHLRRLAMPHAVLSIDVQGDAGEAVSLQLSANPGAPPQPLARIASGGELARTMLALRLVLSSGPPTAVFDEVDAGIGGEAAVAVADALREIAGHRQVIVVTHLPQVAALAGEHLLVSKSVVGSVTRASVAALAEEERVREVARMLSGGIAESAALDHARELLKAVRGRPKSRR